MQIPQDNQGWTRDLVSRVEALEIDLEPDYEARLSFPAKRHRFVLGLGSIPTEVTTDSDGIASYLQQEFGAFLESTEPVVRIALGQTEPERFPFRTLRGTLTTYARDTRVVGKFREMTGYIDTAARLGRGLIAGSNYRQDLSNYLRLMIDAMTPPLEALLFHTAALLHRGKAYLFYGPSTAGKSTLSKLSAPREVMTDDMLVLRYADGVVRAATCGFWGGETKEYPSKRLDVPVAAFLRLRKADVHRLVPIPPVQAALDVVCGVPGLERPVADERFLLRFASLAAAQVPFHELHFHKRDASFWDLLDELK